MKKIGFKKEAEQILKLSEEDDIFTISPEMKRLRDSGRYEITREDDDDIESYRVSPSGVSGWPEQFQYMRHPDSGEMIPRRSFRYNSDMSEVYEEEDEFGITSRTRLKDGWIEKLPEEGPLMYRGMSYEEWMFIQETGRIESLGDYNLGDEQIGLTYFSTEPDSAAHYAHGFAPSEYKATPDKPAYVIGVPRQEGEPVAGVGEHEVGVRGPVDASLIEEVWIGMPYFATTNGRVDVIDDYRGRRSGSRYLPSVSVAWKRVK